MYSYEDRMKAVELYIKYDLSAAATIRELGYPNRIKKQAIYTNTITKRQNIHQNRRRLLSIIILSMDAIFPVR